MAKIIRCPHCGFGRIHKVRRNGKTIVFCHLCGKEFNEVK